MFARNEGYNEAKCVNNFCNYVRVLPVGSTVSCSTSPEERSGEWVMRKSVTTCEYNIPEN
jgi:hypothetical protein